MTPEIETLRCFTALCVIPIVIFIGVAQIYMILTAGKGKRK